MDRIIKVEQPAPPRHTITSTANGLSITIPAKTKWYFFPFMVVWLGFWIIMCFGVLSLLIFSIIGPLISHEKISGGWFFPLMLLPFLLALYAYGRFGWGIFFWYLAGREVIQVNREFITITNQVWRW